MKKIIVPVVAVLAFTTLAFAGENYFHSIKAEFGAFASRLGVGVSEANPSYVLDVAGASRLTGAPTIVGNATLTGNLAQTGAQSVVGSVAVSTSASSTVTLAFKGFTVTLSTRPASKGEVWGQSSDNTLWMSTAIPAHNDVTYAGTAAYIKLSN